MTKLESRDVFTDRGLLVDPYSYFNAVRNVGPVHRMPQNGIVLVTGYEECREALTNGELFSSISSAPGPATPLPFEPHGDDITEQLAEHRSEMPGSDMVITMDGNDHQRQRSLLNKLFVPSRLKANEDYMKQLCDRMVAEIVERGECEIVHEVAIPFVTLVISDLLGVPNEDRPMFREALAEVPLLYDVDNPNRNDIAANGYLELGAVFYGYLQDRRENPRDDILTQFAQSTYPDGSIPDIGELVRIALILFGAGQDTSAKLLANALRYLCDNPEMQAKLRADRKLLGGFIEEMMRLEGSTKMTSRVALRKTTLGGVDIPAGQRLAVVVAGANRDPRKYDDPNEFRLGRSKAMEHLGFGRGAHVCIGAPLARAEVRIFLDRLLSETSSIVMEEGRHGPRGDRSLNYERSYGMRGLQDLHLRLEPAKDRVAAVVS